MAVDFSLGAGRLFAHEKAELACANSAHLVLKIALYMKLLLRE